MRSLGRQKKRLNSWAENALVNDVDPAIFEISVIRRSMLKAALLARS